jgi:hypothetical protein
MPGRDVTPAVCKLFTVARSTKHAAAHCGLFCGELGAAVAAERLDASLGGGERRPDVWKVRSVQPKPDHVRPPIA